MDQFPSVKVMEGRMSTALQNLSQVADELREHGYNHEANKIGQLSVELVNTFNGVSLKSKDSAHGPQRHHSQQQISGMLSLTTPNAGSGLGTLHGRQNLAVVEQTSSVLPREDIGQQISLRVPTSENTWARVVSTASTVQASERASFRGNRSLKQTVAPSVSMRYSNRFSPATKDVVEMYSIGTGSRQDDSNNSPLEDGKAGVVIVEGPLGNVPKFLSFMATRIHEGAVYDMCKVNDHKAIAVFQFALHAQIFVDRNTESVATRNESIFGKGDWSVSLGQPMHWTDTLKRMCHPHRERRRLTFVKSRLFADHASYLKWVREVEDVAGFGNVDFVWAFNTGNATAVFFSVAVARKVMQTFTNWRANRGCYEDLTVSYSSDPCEKELQLTTQLRYHVQPPHRTFEQLGPTGDNADHHSSRRS